MSIHGYVLNLLGGRELDLRVFTSLDFVKIIFYRTRSSANLEGWVFVFISPSGREAQLCRQAPGSLFVAFYDSQD
jgi:hypothetical protein